MFDFVLKNIKDTQSHAKAIYLRDEPVEEKQKGGRVLNDHFLRAERGPRAFGTLLSFRMTGRWCLVKSGSTKAWHHNLCLKPMSYIQDIGNKKSRAFHPPPNSWGVPLDLLTSDFVLLALS